MRDPSQLRPHRQPAAAVSTSVLFILSLLPNLSRAKPYPRDEIHDSLGLGFLMPRDCAGYCGADNQYCCSSGTECYTSDGIAGCSSGSGGYAFYVTTNTESETYTSTYTSAWTAASTTGCSADAGDFACGDVCCGNWQYCAYGGECVDSGTTTGGGGGGGGGYTAGGQTITTMYSPAVYVTGAIASATSTSNAAIGTGSSGGLSGGAIAGIVIGTIAGLLLLLALCACCIARGAWAGLVALLCPGRRRRRRDGSEVTETVIEERFTRQGSGYVSAAAAADARKTRRNNTIVIMEEKRRKKSGGGLGLSAGIGTLLLLLGLRRDKKRRQKSQSTSRTTRSSRRSSGRSDYSYTYGTPTTYSSDNRSRNNRRVSRTRVDTRVSRTRPMRSVPRSPRSR